jgi:hypothetical protein
MTMTRRVERTVAQSVRQLRDHVPPSPDPAEDKLSS